MIRRPALAPALVVTVVAEAALVAPNHLSEVPGVLLALVAVGAWWVVVSHPALEARPGWAVAAMATAFALALAFPPRGSHDLWSYVMYGRTVAVHHASPYVHAPHAYPTDPFLHLVGSGWRGTKSVYGPLFTLVSAGLVKVAGASVLRARLAFQGLALLGVVVALALLWFETHSVRTLAFVGLHPAVVTAILNGGHNDGLVGLAVLLGGMLVARRRFTAAGIAVGLGLLVKASTGFGLLGIAVWVFGRDRRKAVQFVAVAVVTTGIGYAVAGSAALSNLTGSAGRTSRASIWSPIAREWPNVGIRASVATVLVLAVLAAVRLRTRETPALPASGAMAAYLFAGAYVLPWYPAWVLPSAALARRSWLSVLVALHAGFLVAAYEMPRRVPFGSVTAVVRGVALGTVAGAVITIFVVFLARPGPAGTRRPDRATMGGS